MKNRRRNLVYSFFLLTSLVLGILIVISCSPWPSALVIRHVFNKEGRRINGELQKHVPTGITKIPNQSYLPTNKDTKMDVYFPTNVMADNAKLPVIVWVHGGAWISGSKDQLSNYCQILASKGFTVIAINYSLAPDKKYPLPVLQANHALAYIVEHAEDLHVDTSQIILAGDSGGSHIISQLATVVSDDDYAKLMEISPSIRPEQLKGLLLYCGAYDAAAANLDGKFSWFLKTVFWSYSGVKDYTKDERFKQASVINYVTPSFPPVFISAGNGDPLLQQSKSFGQKLAKMNVPVDSLFFPEGLVPKLPHEYQFNLDTEAGQMALDRSLDFINLVTKKGL